MRTTGFAYRFVAARTDREGAGEIVDEAGTVLGCHDGYWRYTIGQRRGLGIAHAHPLYVLAIEPDTRRVVVGPADRLRSRSGVRARARAVRGDAVVLHRGSTSGS